MILRLLIPYRANTSPRAEIARLRLVLAIVGDAAVSNFDVLPSPRAHVDIARTQLLLRALADGADWMLWLDDDAEPPADTFSRLYAHREEADVIVPWFVSRAAESVSYESHEHETPLPRSKGVRRIEKTGFHCVLMSRAAAERQMEAATIGDECVPFRTLTQARGRSIGEDHWWFYFARKAGLRVLQDCSIAVGHVGETVLV